MSRILLGIIDRVCVAALAVGIVLLAHPWGAAIDSHASEPLDVNDRIIMRWELPDGTQIMPPEEMALWEYVWLPQTRLELRVSAFEFAAGHLLNDPEMQGHLERHGVSPDEQQLLRFKLGVSE